MILEFPSDGDTVIPYNLGARDGLMHSSCKKRKQKVKRIHVGALAITGGKNEQERTQIYKHFEAV